MEIIKGKLGGALKIVVYGPEGIGKSTFAGELPGALFIDTEGSTKHMDVARFPKPSSWTMLLEEVRHVRDNPTLCRTLCLDTADWAEQLCVNELCAKAQKSGIEEFGYGKGYVYLAEEFGRLLHLLEELVDRGVNVLVTAHAKMRKFEQPDECGAYDRWELKLSKTSAPLLKEWTDMILFANYKTYVVNVDGQGAEKGKNKAQGGKRVMYTTHHPCWDAKNRHDLADELPFSFLSIQHLFQPVGSHTAPGISTVPRATSVVQEAPSAPPTPETPPQNFELLPSSTPTPFAPLEDGISPALLDLMRASAVTEDELRGIVAGKGYYPKDPPIRNYAEDFVKGWVVACWPQIVAAIESDPHRLPF